MDKIKNALQAKKFVFWEEVARDGAQAKTIMSAEQRIDIARRHAEIFSGFGADHLVFAAGFVSIGKEEELIIQQVAENVETCSVAVNCRSVRSEIDMSYNAVKRAKSPRIAYVFPTSERLCRLMLHKSQAEALTQGIEIAKYAKDKIGDIPLDVQLAASFDADPIFIAEAAAKLCEAGVTIAHLGDTRGRIYPKETAAYLNKMLKNSEKGQLYGSYFHNDMGFALVNNLAAIHRGINLSATSWLGLAERNGLLATELLTLHLGLEPEKIKLRLDIVGEHFFGAPVNLKKMHEITSLVSQYTGVPLKVTDPVCGTGVNSISTGTPFVDTVSFQPFDPEKILGMPKQVYVTQLASKRVLAEVSKKMGYELSDSQLDILLSIVKSTAYTLNRSVFPDKELHDLFQKIQTQN